MPEDIQSLSSLLFNLGGVQRQQQDRFRRNFIRNFLLALGLKDPETAMSTLGPIFQQVFAQDVEQIGQSFGGQRTALIDALSSSGFRTGSQAAGQTQLGIGQAQAEVQARRAALMNQLNSLFQGANIASQQVATFNPVGLFGASANFFKPPGPSPLFEVLQSLLSAGGQAFQGAFAGQGQGQGGST